MRNLRLAAMPGSEPTIVGVGTTHVEGVGEREEREVLGRSATRPGKAREIPATCLHAVAACVGADVVDDELEIAGVPTTREVLRPILESSGLTYGEDFFVGFSAIFVQGLRSAE